MSETEISVSAVEAKDALLEAILPNVVFDGWPAAFEAADPARTLFPGGVTELREWLDDWADRRMVEKYAAGNAQGKRTHQRVAACIQARLAALAPYKEAVRLALAGRLNPTGALAASRAAYRTVDTIWYTIGDTSTDFSFYTKRAILAGIYTAAMLYWLSDRSDDAADTVDFIERRLAQIGGAPSISTRLRTSFRSFAAPFEVLRRDLGR